MRLNPIFRRICTTNRNIFKFSWNSSNVIRCESSQSEKFVTVYKNVGIRLISAFATLKKYQLIATMVGIPGSGLLEFCQVIEPGYTLLTTVLGSSTALTLFGMGLLSKNIVGLMYINESKDLIKISYVDYWGARKDVSFPIEDLKPCSEVSRKFTDGFFITLERYSVPESYKLNIKQGVVAEKKILKEILGDFEEKR